MCPPLLKTCSGVIAQFNSSWRQRLTLVAFMTQDIYRRLRNLRRVFLRFGTVFSFEASEDSFHLANEEFFLAYDIKNWCQEISTHKVERTVQSFFSPYWREFKTCAKYAYTVITVQAQIAQKADNSYPPDKSLPSYSKSWSFKLWKLRQNTYKNSRIWCDAREFSSIGRSILLFASLEKWKKLYFVCRCLYSLYLVKYWGFWPFSVKWSLNALKHKSSWRCKIFWTVFIEFLTWAEKSEINQDLFIRTGGLVWPESKYL